MGEIRWLGKLVVVGTIIWNEVEDGDRLEEDKREMNCKIVNHGKEAL